MNTYRLNRNLYVPKLLGKRYYVMATREEFPSDNNRYLQATTPD